jgi:hypothetical protein
MTISFEQRIEQLQKFEADHGHLFISGSQGPNGLGKWVANKRQERQRGKLKQETIHKLDELNFVWVVPKGRGKEELIEWGKQYRWLKNFHEAKGHCNFPSKIAGKAAPVAAWCDTQRQLFMDGKLEQEKVDKLAKLGFDFFGSSDCSEVTPVSSDLRVLFGIPMAVFH